MAAQIEQHHAKIDNCLSNFVNQGDLPFIVAAIGSADTLIYSGAFGQSDSARALPATLETVLQIASATKALTSTAALQLMERGLLDLDAPASSYCPEINRLEVLDGWDENGDPITRPPKQLITIRHLLTHTSGLSYEYWSADIRRYMERKHIPSIGTHARSCLFTPLLFEPGEAWEYGISTDWLGLVIEAITGQELASYMSSELFEPLGMSNTAFFPTPDMNTNMSAVSAREKNNGLVRIDNQSTSINEFTEGGGGLFSTCNDFMRFLQAILKDGAGLHGRILKPETVRLMSKKATGSLKIKPLNTVDPTVSADFEYCPGTEKSWTLAFMRTEAGAPTRRSSGSLGWAGIYNTYFWIDPTVKISGFFSTQLLPFNDDKAREAFHKFEELTYELVSVT